MGCGNSLDQARPFFLELQKVYQPSFPPPVSISTSSQVPPTQGVVVRTDFVDLLKALLEDPDFKDEKINYKEPTEKAINHFTYLTDHELTERDVVTFFNFYENNPVFFDLMMSKIIHLPELHVQFFVRYLSNTDSFHQCHLETWVRDDNIPIELLTTLFLRLDLNTMDNMITPNELITFLNDWIPQAYLTISMTLSPIQFRDKLKKILFPIICENQRKEKFITLFKTLDVNNNHFVEEEEMNCLFNAIGGFSSVNRSKNILLSISPQCQRQILKNLLTQWLREAVTQHNTFSNYLLIHFYHYIRSHNSLLYHPLLYQIIHNYLKRMWSRLLYEMKTLGCSIIYATFEKLIVATNKTSYSDIQSYIQYVIETIMSNPLFEWLEIVPGKCWSNLLFLDQSNYGGMIYDFSSENPLASSSINSNSNSNSELSNSTDLHQSNLSDNPNSQPSISESAGSTFNSVEDNPNKNFTQLTSLWTIADYLPPVFKDVFMILLYQYLQYANDLFISLVPDMVAFDQKLAEYIENTFSHILFSYISKLRSQMVNHPELEDHQYQFPFLPGCHLSPTSPILEFIKYICHLLSLEKGENVSIVVFQTRHLLLKMIEVKEFSRESQYIDPCSSYVLRDVICSYCHQCHDLDLCRDPNLLEGQWICLSCQHWFDLSLIENSLIRIIQKYSMEYQSQDLICHQCHSVSENNCRATCRCSNKWTGRLSPNSFDKTLHTFLNISQFYHFSKLEAVCCWLLRMPSPPFTSIPSAPHVPNPTTTIPSNNKQTRLDQYFSSPANENINMNFSKNLEPIYTE